MKLSKKLGISVKPINQWGAKEVGTVLGAGVGPLGAIVGSQIDGAIDSRRSDAAGKRAEGQSARAVEAAQVAQAYNDERNTSRGMLEGMANTTVPVVTAAALDPTFRNSQMELLQQLTRQSKGEGPSLAQMQFQQAGNTALQKAMGAIRAATGPNAALGGRTAALASTNMLGNIAAESGMARLKEQQDAQNQLAALAASGRTSDLQARQQDIGLGTSNAELAIKNLAQRQAAAGELLGDTRARFEGHYNRGVQGQAQKGGGSDGLLGGLLGAGGAILASTFASPAAAPAGATAGKALGDSMSLTGRPPAVKEPIASRGGGGARIKSGPFAKFAR